jgi:hypothetical protein
VSKKAVGIRYGIQILGLKTVKSVDNFGAVGRYWVRV